MRRLDINRPLLCLAMLIATCQVHAAASLPEGWLADSRSAMRNDPERSRALAEQALQALTRQPDANLQVEAHWLLCDYHAERNREAARRHLDAARALLPQATRPALAAQLLSCEGSLAELAGDNQNAFALYDRAVGLAQTAGDDEVLANALYERGYLHGVRGELASGLIDLRRSNELYEHSHLPEEALNTQLAVATLFDRMGDHAQARRYFDDALQAQRRSGLLREQAVTHHNLGRALQSLGDTVAARASFLSSLAISRELHYARSEAYALRGLAGVENTEGHPEAALALLDQAALLMANAPDERLRGHLALQRGIALRLLGRPAESLAPLSLAERVFASAGAQAELSTALGELAASQAALGNHAVAYQTAQRFKEISDSLLKRQIEERFATLKVEFDNAATERENRVLKREKVAIEKALAEEQRANTLRAVALALAILLVAAMAVLVRRDRRTSRRMHRLAMVDELTQLWNRRHVLGTLQGLLDGGQRCAVMIADIDFFKAINDSHGHLVGDDILRAVAARLRESVPACAEVGRLGGEEFIVVMPVADADEALPVAETLRVAIAALDATRWMPYRGVTVSIGVSLCAPGADMTVSLQQADDALYAAKRDGRNCVRAAGTSTASVLGAAAAPVALLSPLPAAVLAEVKPAS